MTKEEKKLVLEGWYSCMIAMGMISEDEDLYFKAKDMLFMKYGISEEDNVNTGADEHLKEIKDEYNRKRIMDDKNRYQW